MREIKLHLQRWAKSPLFKSVLIYALVFPPLSLCVLGLGHSCCPFALSHSRIVHTIHPPQNPLCFPHNAHDTVERQQENRALNTEFNYSRPSEMLVSRWIRPGSLSKPILDLKGRQLCIRNISIGLLPSGRCHLPKPPSDLSDSLTVKSD